MQQADGDRGDHRHGTEEMSCGLQVQGKSHLERKFSSWHRQGFTQDGTRKENFSVVIFNLFLQAVEDEPKIFLSDSNPR